MSKSNNNGMNKSASNKGRRGPRPIMTVAQLREKLLRDAMVKEAKKIDRKIAKLMKRETQLNKKMTETRDQLATMRGLYAEYSAEVNA